MYITKNKILKTYFISMFDAKFLHMTSSNNIIAKR